MTEPISEERPEGLLKALEAVEAELTKSIIRTPMKREDDHLTCMACRSLVNNGHPVNNCPNSALYKMAVELRRRLVAGESQARVS